VIKKFENFQEDWEEEPEDKFEGMEFDTYVHTTKLN
jgi:hypothetical protein